MGRISCYSRFSVNVWISRAARPFWTERREVNCSDVISPSTIPISLLTARNRVVYALIIINKAGGLIYQRDFAEGLNKLSVNDYLVLAGTFHGFVVPFVSRFSLPSYN